MTKSPEETVSEDSEYESSWMDGVKNVLTSNGEIKFVEPLIDHGQ